MERVKWRAAPVLGALLALLAGCQIRIDDRSTTEANLEAAAREAILSELRAYYRDFTALDSAAFLSHFWPGADVTTVWQPPGEPAPRVVVTPAEAFVAQWAAGPGSKPVFEERLLRADVRLTGNLAQVWARYAARFGDSSAVQEWEGLDAFTLMRVEGRWKIVELAFTSVGAAAR